MYIYISLHYTVDNNGGLCQTFGTYAAAIPHKISIGFNCNFYARHTYASRH